MLPTEYEGFAATATSDGRLPDVERCSNVAAAALDCRGCRGTKERYMQVLQTCVELDTLAKPRRASFNCSPDVSAGSTLMLTDDMLAGNASGKCKLPLV